MSLNIVEFFGYSPSDPSKEAKKYRSAQECPFVGGLCIKLFRDGERTGGCTFSQTQGGTVISCPNRLYSDNYKVLLDVSASAFDSQVPLLQVNEALTRSQDEKVVAVFGKRWGRELRLPSRAQARAGAYFVDWILALIDKGRLEEFVALEVQTIDTTGSYRAERDAYMQGRPFQGRSNAGLNWENVSKRILPQIIYKGHVLRREPLCKKGMYFVCPLPVHERIIERLGGQLLDYSPHPGALTFVWYDIGPQVGPGLRRNLISCGQRTTTVDQVAQAFTNPANLPPSGVYAKAIELELNRMRSRG